MPTTPSSNTHTHTLRALELVLEGVPRDGLFLTCTSRALTSLFVVLSVFLSAPSRFLFSFPRKLRERVVFKLRGNQRESSPSSLEIRERERERFLAIPAGLGPKSAKSAKYRGILWVYLENPGYARVLWRHVVVHLRTRGVSLVLPSGTATRKKALRTKGFHPPSPRRLRPRQIHPPARSPAPLHTNSAPHDRLASPPLHCPFAGCRRCRRRHTPLCSCRRER